MAGLLAQLQAISAVSQKAAKHLSSYQLLLSEPVSNAYTRENVLSELSALAVSFPDSEVKASLAKWLESEQARVEKDKEEFRFGFGKQLAAALEQSSLKLRGQLPVLRIGMFSLRMDFGAGKALLFWGPEVEKLEAIPKLVPDGLAKTVVRWTQSLKDKAAEPGKLAASLLAAYRRLCEAGGLAAGARVALTDILAEMVLTMQSKGFRANPSRENFTEYPRVRFSYDLFRLKASLEVGLGHGPTFPALGHDPKSQEDFGHVPGRGHVPRPKLRLHVATFDATTDKTKALWVPDNEEGEGTYYSYVSVVGEGDR